MSNAIAFRAIAQLGGSSNISVGAGSKSTNALTILENVSPAIFNALQVQGFNKVSSIDGVGIEVSVPRAPPRGHPIALPIADESHDDETLKVDVSRRKTTGSPVLLTDKRAEVRLSREDPPAPRSTMRRLSAVEIAELVARLQDHAPETKPVDTETDEFRFRTQALTRTVIEQQMYLKELCKPRPVPEQKSTVPVQQSVPSHDAILVQSQSCNRLCQPRTLESMIRTLSPPPPPAGPSGVYAYFERLSLVPDVPLRNDGIGVDRVNPPRSVYAEDLSASVPVIRQPTPEHIGLLQAEIMSMSSSILKVADQAELLYPDRIEMWLTALIKRDILPSLTKRAQQSVVQPLQSATCPLTAECLSLAVSFQPSQLCLVRLLKLKRDLLFYIESMCDST